MAVKSMPEVTKSAEKASDEFRFHFEENFMCFFHLNTENFIRMSD